MGEEVGRRLLDDMKFKRICAVCMTNCPFTALLNVRYVMNTFFQVMELISCHPPSLQINIADTWCHTLLGPLYFLVVIYTLFVIIASLITIKSLMIEILSCNKTKILDW